MDYFAAIVLADGVKYVDVDNVKLSEILVDDCPTCHKPKTEDELIEELAGEFAEALAGGAEYRFTAAVVKHLLPKLVSCGLI